MSRKPRTKVGQMERLRLWNEVTSPAGLGVTPNEGYVWMAGLIHMGLDRWEMIQQERLSPLKEGYWDTGYEGQEILPLAFYGYSLGVRLMRERSDPFTRGAEAVASLVNGHGLRSRKALAGALLAEGPLLALSAPAAFFPERRGLNTGFPCEASLRLYASLR